MELKITVLVLSLVRCAFRIYYTKLSNPGTMNRESATCSSTGFVTTLFTPESMKFS